MVSHLDFDQEYFFQKMMLSEEMGLKFKLMCDIFVTSTRARTFTFL